MEEIELRKLAKKDEAAYQKYVGEFLNAGERIIPSTVYKEGLIFDEWLEFDRKRENKIQPEGRVPATLLFLFRKGESSKIIGAIDIRNGMTDLMLKYNGNIGYGIAPSERKKGYAGRMLAMALKKCEQIGLKRVLVTCDKDNTGSARTIMKNGGVLENEVIDPEGKIKQRYWIEIK